MANIKAYYDASTCTGGIFQKDGSILFLSNRSGVNQVWEKKPGQPMQQRTFLKERIWSLYPAPNGEDCFVSMDWGGNEQEQILLLKKGETVPIDLTQDPTSRNQFGGVTPDGKTLVYASNARSAANFDICTLDIETGEKKIVLRNDDHYNWPCCLSPNGRYLLYNKLKGTSNNHMFLLDLQTGQAKDVGTPGAYADYTKPAFLHDNSAFYLCSDEGSEFKVLSRYDIAAGTLEKVWQTGWDVEAVAVSADDRYLSVMVNEDGYDTLHIFDRNENRFVDAACPKQGVMGYWRMDWSRQGHRLLFTQTTASRPAYLSVLDIDQNTLQTVASVPLEGIDESALTEPELRHYKSFDGLTVPYWYYRAKSAPQGPGAVLVEIHGGPEGQERPMYNALKEYLLAEGISIVAPNIRGSVGYGKTYTHLDDVEKRLDSVKDVEALVGHLIDQGIAQEGRLAVMGASYGGFMTLSCVSRQPKLWKCGVDIVGMTNLVTFLENTSSYRRAHRESEYGSLARDRQTLYEVSPIAKVNDIQAPMMVIHGVNDPRVPVSEADLIVENLRRRGIEVEYLRYDDEGHGLSKRKNQLDCYPRVAAFIQNKLQIKTGEEASL